MHHHLRASIVAALVSVASSACAQPAPIPKSQLGVVSQLVAGTRIEITWRRPVARGRALFGALVPWGRVWTPSADSAARLTTTGPVEIQGQQLPPGTYSLWAIPDSSAWTIVVNRVPNTFHLSYPEGRDVMRVRATPRSGEWVESLMFAFPMVDGDSARLELRWGATVVPLSIHVRT